MIEKLADGSWLTWERMRGIAVLTAAMTFLTLAWLYVTASGTVDAFGRPLGTDFSNVWTAGRMALDGAAPVAWDWPSHYEVQQATHGRPDIPFYGWHYPPPFLMLAALLALLPYLAALLVWQVATLSLAAGLLHRILPDRRALLLGLCAPVVFVCVGHGHNGFLTATLLAGGLYLLDRKPVAAGLLLGCLLYKPQLAVLVPPLLLVTGSWRAFAAAALSSGMLVLATLLLWGWPVWAAFIDSLPLTQKVIIESGATGWEKIQTPFGMIRMWGGSLPLSYAVQTLAAVLSVGTTLWLARRAAPELRNAAAMAAALLSTPYVLDYDFVVLGFGIAFLTVDGLRRGFLDWEKSLLALVWVSPLVARQIAALALIPLGQASACVVLALALRRAVALDAALPDSVRALSFRHSHGWSGR